MFFKNIFYIGMFLCIQMWHLCGQFNYEVLDPNNVTDKKQKWVNIYLSAQVSGPCKRISVSNQIEWNNSLQKYKY